MYMYEETILKCIASCHKKKKKTILICIFKMFQEIKCRKLSQLIKNPEFKTCQLHNTQDKMSPPAGCR